MTQTGAISRFRRESSVHVDAALDKREDQHTADLAALDIMSLSSKPRSLTLQGLSVLVVGGGPAGLTVARAASIHGARVTVLEKAGDPRGSDLGYTNRSFNISLERVGRYVLGSKEAWQGGIRVIGRAIHGQGVDKVIYTTYGPSPDYDLVNIPRPLLRQNMVNLALQEGATIHFESRVTHLDPDKGEATAVNRASDSHVYAADLVVVSDGLHSIADSLITAASDKEYYLKPEPRRIVSALIPAEANLNLSLHDIHFWYEESSDSFVVGIPNRDGSVALLLASPYADARADSHPFATSNMASKRLRRDFPQLFSLYPYIAQQLPRQPVYHFKYKAHSTFRVGHRGVIIGDAGCVMPPWANYGANSAIASASSLVYHLVERRGNIDAALDIFQSHQRVLSRLLLDYAAEHGKFFSGPIMRSPQKRSDSVLAELIKQAGQRPTP